MCIMFCVVADGGTSTSFILFVVKERGDCTEERNVLQSGFDQTGTYLTTVVVHDLGTNNNPR